MIRIFPASKVKEIDSYTVDHEPVSADRLMERAALRCSQWLLENCADHQSFRIFAGPGNNGGDGLVIARHLAEKRKKVKVYTVGHEGTVSDLVQLNKQRLKEQGLAVIYDIKSKNDFPDVRDDDVVIDALFGSGISRPLQGINAELIQYLNRSRAYKVTIDIPSGLFGEYNSSNDRLSVFKADATLTFEFPFLSFMLSDNAAYTGDLHILPIGLHPEAIRQSGTDFFLLEEQDVLIRKRRKFSHKGTFGHGLLIAGSYGMMGAAVLAARACLRSGIGLLTTHVPKDGYEIMQTAVPESIVSIDKSKKHFTSLPELKKYSAIAIGCGIGQGKHTRAAFHKLLDKVKRPCVIDADALNILSNDKKLLKDLPDNTILTPHPGEFDRLFGKSDSAWERLMKQKAAAEKYKITIILKGAYTSIAVADGRVFFNPTGNPGMATGGSGDILTGMILSFLSQGYDTLQSAINAVYLHGLAGDMAALKTSEESLIATDLADELINAIKKMKHS